MIHNIWRRLFHGASRPQPIRKGRTFRPGVEMLEAREVPDAKTVGGLMFNSPALFKAQNGHFISQGSVMIGFANTPFKALLQTSGVDITSSSATVLTTGALNVLSGTNSQQIITAGVNLGSIAGLSSAAFPIPANQAGKLIVAGLSFTPTNFKLVSSSQTVVMAGSLSFADLNNVTLPIDAATTKVEAGVAGQNAPQLTGKVSGLQFKDSQFTIGSVGFTTSGVTVDFSSPNTFTVKGTATATFPRDTGVNPVPPPLVVTVSLANSGLQVTNGKLTKLTVNVTSSSFMVAGLTVTPGAKGVTLTYSNGKYGLTGQVGISTGTQDDGSQVFNNLQVTLGVNNSAPGLQWQNGILTAANIKLTTALTIGGFTLAPKNLTINYDGTAKQLQLTGAVMIQVGSVSAAATMPGKGITINTQTGKVTVNGFTLAINNMDFGLFNLSLSGAFSQDNKGKVSWSGSSTVAISGNTIMASFAFRDGALKALALSFSSTTTPLILGGLSISSLSGSIDNLDNPQTLVFQGAVSGALTVSGNLITFAGNLKVIRSKDITLTGTVTVISKNIATGTITATGNLSKKTLQIAGTLNMLGGVIMGTTNFTVDAGPSSSGISFDTTLTVTLPANFPQIGGKVLASSIVKFRMSADGTRLEIDASANNLALGLIQKFEYSYERIQGVDYTYGYAVAPAVTMTKYGSDWFPIYVPAAGFAPYSFGTPPPTSVLKPNTAARTALAPAAVPAADPGVSFATLESAAAPTMTILAATATSDPNQTLISYQAVTDPTLTAGSTVSLFIDTQSSGYQGIPIVSQRPFDPTNQSFTWKYLPYYLPQPFVPNQPLYIYAEIDDGIHAPAFSAYSGPITPVNTEPAIGVPPQQNFAEGTPVVFSAANGNALTITDPLAAFAATAKYPPQVTVVLQVQNGTLSSSSPLLDDLGGGAYTLTDSAADINAALDGLTYTPQAGTALDDALQITAGRVPSAYAPNITATVPLMVSPLVVDTGAGQSSIGTGVTYTQDSGPSALLPELVLTDDDIPWIASASVAVDNYVPGEDQLIFAPPAPSAPGQGPNDMTAAFDAQTGVLTFTGLTSVDEYQAALANVQFASTGSGVKGLTVTATDELGDGADASLPITILPVTQPPAVEPSGVGLLFTEGSPPAPLDPGITVSDPVGNGFVGATVAFDASSYVLGEDMLEFVPQGNITGTFDPASGILTLTGTASAAAYQAALASVDYANPALPVTEGVLDVTITVDDGQATNNLGTGPERILVGGDQPVLAIANLAVSPTVVAAPVDDTPVSLAGDLVIDDTNTPTLVGAEVAIVAGYSPGEDVLALGAVDTPGITVTFDAQTGVLELSGLAPLDEYQTALQSVTYQNQSAVHSGQPRILELSIDDGLAPVQPVTLTLEVAPTLYVDPGTDALQYTAGQTDMAVAPNLVLTDNGGFTLTGATVAIDANYLAGEDRLDYTADNGIQGTFDPESGVLFLQGQASVTAYQDALRSVTYFNTRANPDAGIREVAIDVTDNDGSSDPDVYLDVNPVDQPDQLTVTSGLTTYTQTSPPLAVFATLTIQDPDAATASRPLYGATVAIDGFVAGQDILTFTAQGNITGDFDTTTGQLVLTGVDTVANYQAVLQSVMYQDTASLPAEGQRTLTVLLDDGSGTTHPAEVSTPLVVVSTDPAVTLVGTTLRFNGTAGDDTFTFTAGSSEQATFNGVTYPIDPTVVSTVDFQGNGGSDMAFLTAAGSNNSASLALGAGTLEGTGYTVSVSDVTDLVINGGNTDSASFADTSGSNTFIGAPAYSYLTSGKQLSEVMGFANVTADSTSGMASAQLSDTTGSNMFVGTPSYSYLKISGTSAMIEVVGFPSVAATAAPGTSDDAYLYDFSGSNMFVATPAYSYLNANGTLNEVMGFKTVGATAAADTTDTAYYYDSVGHNSFVGTPAYSDLTSGGVFNEAVGFARSAAIAPAGGQDTAVLYGSSGVGSFVGTPTYGYYISAGVFNEAFNFASVVAQSMGGEDSAVLYDGPGFNKFVATPAYAMLTGGGYSNLVIGFTGGVMAQGSAGSSDIAYLYGSSAGGNTFVGTPADSYLSGSGFGNEAKGFGTVWGYSQGPGDMASLNASPSGDTFSGSGTLGSLVGTGYSINLDSFAQVVANGVPGATNKLSLAALDYVFSDVGTWLPV